MSGKKNCVLFKKKLISLGMFAKGGGSIEGKYENDYI